jgi:hypothetical protein
LSAAIWKVWAPPKCNFFAWLIMQNRIWMANRIHKRGWSNCRKLPLWNQVQESPTRLVYRCRFKRI